MEGEQAADGAGAGCRVVFGAILGTGVGGGIVFEGRILTGLNRIGGEWGHNPLPWATEDERPGYRCYCGKFGCRETFLSGAGLAREYFSLSKNELTAEQIAAAEKAGEPYAVRSLATYKDRLARSLAAFVNILDDRFHETDHGTGNLLADSSFVVDRTRSGIMAGWRQAVALAMTGEEIEALTALSRSRTEPAGRVSRAAMLLGYREKPSFFAVGQRLGVHHQTVKRCVERALAYGALAALDAPNQP